MGAKKKQQDTIAASDLGLAADEIGEAGSQTEVYAVGAPPERSESRRIEDDGNAAEAVVDYLAEKKLI
jgi:electron transfer flavoprotein beta subunit